VKDCTPQEALRSPVFWIMYVMFVLVGVTLAALTFALSLNNIMNGIMRPLLGWVSDSHRT
jgi:OFA family oxalate/formate antiporter-like MFS transporter